MNKLLLLAGVLLATACSDSSDRQPLPVGVYDNDAYWLCRPGMAGDACEAVDLTTTLIHGENSWEVVEHQRANNPGVDCFYVYPTRDYREQPGNTSYEDARADLAPILQALHNQAARFSSICRVYAPLYRQMTIGTYGVAGGYQNSSFFHTAVADAELAFNQYLNESRGRPFVLLGHSQGSHVLIELIRRRIDNNPRLRERLVSALLIGPTGTLQVPEGALAGGSFQHIPLCSAAAETGCVVAYDSVAALDLVQRPIRSRARACVDPTRLGGNPGVLANLYVGEDNGLLPLPEGIETPWIAYPELHTAACEGDGLLGIGVVEGDAREPFLPIALMQAILGSLHIADYNFGMGDLLRIVEAQVDSLP